MRCMCSSTDEMPIDLESQHFFSSALLWQNLHTDEMRKIETSTGSKSTLTALPPQLPTDRNSGHLLGPRHK